jgi:monothiol glutaredoxin
MYILIRHHQSQLYVDGEFMGGSDIMIELYQSGELETTMKDKGVKFNA